MAHFGSTISKSKGSVMRFQTSYAVVFWNENIQAGPKSSHPVLTSPDPEAYQLTSLSPCDAFSPGFMRTVLLFLAWYS